MEVADFFHHQLRIRTEIQVSGRLTKGDGGHKEFDEADVFFWKA